MSSPYLHGTDPEEQRRLSRLNDLLNQESLRMLELRGDERILDVWPLPGGTAAEIAEAVLRTTDLYLGEGCEPPDDRTVVILKVTGEDL